MFAPLMGMQEASTCSAYSCSRCICVGIGYLAVLVPVCPFLFTPPGRMLKPMSKSQRSAPDPLGGGGPLLLPPPPLPPARLSVLLPAPSTPSGVCLLFFHTNPCCCAGGMCRACVKAPWMTVAFQRKARFVSSPPVRDGALNECLPSALGTRIEPELPWGGPPDVMRGTDGPAGVRTAGRPVAGVHAPPPPRSLAGSPVCLAGCARHGASGAPHLIKIC